MQNADILKNVADAITSAPASPQQNIFSGNIVDANKIQNERQVMNKIRGGLVNTDEALSLLGGGMPYNY